MTDQGKGPARVVENENGFYHVHIFDVSLLPSFGWLSEADTMSGQINQALSPLTRKADLCGRMAKALDGVMEALETDSPALCEGTETYKKYMEAAKVKAEFDREA